MEGYNNDSYNLAIVGWFNKKVEIGGHRARRKNWKVDSATQRALRGFGVQGEDVARFSV